MLNYHLILTVVNSQPHNNEFITQTQNIFVALHLFSHSCADVNAVCLWLSSPSDRAEVYLGDENSLSLTFNARNEGEGGAYEAELYVALPPEADYSGIARSNAVSRANCQPNFRQRL